MVHFGTMIRNNIRLNDTVYNFCLIHLLPDGIYIHFSNYETEILDTLKRPHLVNGELKISDWLVNRTPFTQFSNVINRTFIKQLDDGSYENDTKWNKNFFKLFRICHDQAFKYEITTRVGELNKNIVDFVNCKRFTQIFAQEFRMKIPKDWKDVILATAENRIRLLEEKKKDTPSNAIYIINRKDEY